MTKASNVGHYVCFGLNISTACEGFEGIFFTDSKHVIYMPSTCVYFGLSVSWQSQGKHSPRGFVFRMLVWLDTNTFQFARGEMLTIIHALVLSSHTRCLLV